MDEANRSVASYFLLSYTSSSCWTCGNPCHSMENRLEKREYKRKPIDHYLSHLRYEPSSNTFDSYPCSTSRQPSNQQPCHDQSQNISETIDRHLKWMDEQIQEIKERMNNTSIIQQESSSLIQHIDEVIHSLRQGNNHQVINEITTHQVSHLVDRADIMEAEELVTNQVGEDDLNFKDVKEEEKVSFVEEEQYVIERYDETSLSTLTHIIVKAVVRLPNLKLKTLGERGIKGIFVRYVEHSKAFRFYVIEPKEPVSIKLINESKDAIFNENRFYSVPRLSLMIPNRTGDIGGSVVPEEVTKEVVTQQLEPELRKSKRNRTPKNFGPEFQLYLIKGTRDEVSDQHSYCFNVEDDPKTFNEAMKSQDVAFWKEAINDEMDFIMGKNTWVLANLPPGKGVIICLYVDDMLIFGTDQVQVDLKKESLSSIFSMKDMKEADVILVLDGYTDASWISNTEYNSSTSGWVFLLGGAAGKEVEWLRNLIFEIPLWSKPIAPISIFCDSVATLAKAYSQMYNEKSDT
ncbi:hypothetical protein Tco_1154906 [Tanacetum coccineum]